MFDSDWWHNISSSLRTIEVRTVSPLPTKRISEKDFIIEYGLPIHDDHNMVWYLILTGGIMEVAA